MPPSLGWVHVLTAINLSYGPLTWVNVAPRQALLSSRTGSHHSPHTPHVLPQGSGRRAHRICGRTRRSGRTGDIRIGVKELCDSQEAACSGCARGAADERAFVGELDFWEELRCPIEHFQGLRHHLLRSDRLRFRPRDMHGSQRAPPRQCHRQRAPRSSWVRRCSHCERRPHAPQSVRGGRREAAGARGGGEATWAQESTFTSLPIHLS